MVQGSGLSKVVWCIQDKSHFKDLKAGYVSQIKNVSQLEEKVSRAISQNLLASSPGRTKLNNPLGK